MGAAHGDAVFLGGVFEQLADAGVGLARGWVGEDVASGFFVGLEQFEGFGWDEAEALPFGFGGGDEAAAVFPAQVLPFEVAGFVEAQAGGVDEVEQGFLEGALFFAGAGFEEVLAHGFDDFLKFAGAGGLGDGFLAWEQGDFEGQGLGLAVGDHPVDEDFEVLQALVGVGGGGAVPALEVFDELGGDVAYGVDAEVGFYFFHGPADGFVIAGAFVEFDVAEIVGDDIVEARVADDALDAVLLGEFGPTSAGVFKAADVGFVVALEGVLAGFGVDGFFVVGAPVVDDPGPGELGVFFNGHG